MPSCVVLKRGLIESDALTLQRTKMDELLKPCAAQHLRVFDAHRDKGSLSETTFQDGAAAGWTPFWTEMSPRWSSAPLDGAKSGRLVGFRAHFL